MEVVVDRLSKRFGRLVALDEVSLSLVPGQIMVVLGPNGAGKTTLLRCLAGLYSPSSGQIWYDRKAFQRDDIELRRRIFFMPDQTVGFSHYNVLQHITMALKLYGRGDEQIEERVVQLLKDLDLLDLAFVPLAALSRGQLYKAGLAAMIAVDAELWLVDEPFASGMDPNGISKFKQYASRAAAAGRTVVYTTQILDIAEKFCTHFCLLDSGRAWLVESAARLSEWGTSDSGALESLFQKLRG